MSAVITLLTDFGTADGYVAEMKGVLLRLETYDLAQAVANRFFCRDFFAFDKEHYAAIFI